MSSEITFVDQNDQLKATVREENGATRVTLEDLRNGQVQELARGSEGYRQITELAQTVEAQKPKGFFGPDISLQEHIDNAAAVFRGNGLSVHYNSAENGRFEQGNRLMAGDLSNLRGGNANGGRGNAR